MGHSFYMIPFIGAIGFFFSLLLVVLLQRIPVLKFTVP
jgi:hypothetical protein